MIGGDRQDDVIAFLYSCAATFSPFLGGAVEPLWIVLASSGDLGIHRLASERWSTEDSRAPPSSALVG